MKKRPCEICGQLIDEERIEVVPGTRLCGEHARQIQKHGGEFIVIATQERTSKAGSLKHNYGSVSTSKKRNHEALAKLREEYLEQRSSKP
ncbi:MAG TPA: TraR/DksA C4-type zinc finger protein [Nitrososphaera sp.]|nr:TraR/DksA C4-type zinc finger protein [Nitrososphaera sp.]